MTKSDLKLLETLCGIIAPSGNEIGMKQFLIDYVKKNQAKWAVQPEIIEGEQFQDCFMLKFGKPRTAVFAHMDSIGFSVRYENQLIPIGGPEAQNDYVLVGEDSMGMIECKLKIQAEGHLFYDFGRGIDRGTNLVFKCNFRVDDNYIESCYLDNRLGIFNVLKLAESLKDGLIVFSCWEEHGGGTVPFLSKYMYEQLGIKQALISDITWITEGVKHGKGVAISMRDMNIPRRQFVNRIIDLAKVSGVPFQLEVEGSGGSDGREIQATPYPIDWCFIGAAEDNVHSPDEKVHIKDVQAMIDLYRYLMLHL